MGSLSDSIAEDAKIEAWKEYRKRKQEALDQLLASVDAKTREIIVKAIKLAMDLT